MKSFEYQFRVHAGDTDYGGVMYHPNYIDFFERARVEWFIHLGINLAELAKDGFLFPVASLSVDYLKPVFFNDVAVINSCITRVGKVSIVFAQGMFKDDVCVARATVKVGCINREHRPVVLMDNIMQILREEQ